MLKMRALFFLLFFVVPLSGYNQFEVIYTPPCDYIPLEFQEDIDYVWTHLVIDSSFIEYRDTNARYQPYYKDGMEQFGFDGGSFINGGFLYSITSVEYDLDLSGYYIEKIDVQTGEKKWTIRTDKRFTEYREKALSFEIVDDEFIIYGIRCALPDSILSPSSFALGGRIDSYFFQRNYNVESGELLSYNSVQESDENAFNIHYRMSNNYLAIMGEGQFDYLTFVASEEGGFTEREKITEYGLMQNQKDTIAQSFYNGIDLSNARFTFSRKFLQLNSNNILHIDQIFFGEDYDDAPPQTRVMIFDKDYNIIKQVDLRDLDINNYGRIILLGESNDGKILLRGCIDQNLNLPCRYFYLVFDKDLNHLNTLKPYIENHYFSFSFNTELVQSDNSIIAIDRRTELNGNSKFIIYRLKFESQFDTINTLTIKEPNWGAWVSNAFQLDDGDMIIKFNYGCLNENSQFASWNPTWMRLKAEDLQLITSTEDIVQKQNSIHAYPNPVSDVLNLKSDGIISGSINIVNGLGKVVYNQNINTTSEFKINVAHLEPGMYNIAVFGVDGSSQTIQFVKL